MNPNLSEQLAALRPWHLPDPVSWWPPAPGWWLLAALALAALFALAGWLRRRWYRQAPVRRALRELGALDALAARDPALACRQLSQLLRRVALARFPRGEVAGLTGEAWLAFLDRHGGDGQFDRGPGRVLIQAPYRAAAPDDLVPLIALARRWIERQRKVAA